MFHLRFTSKPCFIGTLECFSVSGIEISWHHATKMSLLPKSRENFIKILLEDVKLILNKALLIPRRYFLPFLCYSEFASIRLNHRLQWCGKRCFVFNEYGWTVSACYGVGDAKYFRVVQTRHSHASRPSSHMFYFRTILDCIIAGSLVCLNR